MTAAERAALAYHIATGRTLEDREAVVRWCIAVLAASQVMASHRRAVEAMIPWLDEVVSDDDTRARLGLVLYPAWVDEETYSHAALYLEPCSVQVAIVDGEGWTAYRDDGGSFIAGGPETGTAGMDAAEAALRRAGVLAEGVTVRRPDVYLG